MKLYKANIIINKEITTRTIKALSLQNAKDILAKEGVVISIKEINQFGLNLSFGKINERDLSIYIRQLSVLLEAGVSVLDAFVSVGNGCDNARLRQIFSDISMDLHAGASLEQALSGYKKELGTITLAMFSLGQNSGKLSNSLSLLSFMLEEIDNNKTKFKKAIRYPAIVLLTLIIAFNILIAMVVPSFNSVFASVSKELPLATRIILGLESLINDYGFFVVFGAVLSTCLVLYFYKFSFKFRFKFDSFALKIPLLKGIILHSSLARFNLILSQLISAGMAMDRALDIANTVIENSYIKSKINQSSKDICNANALSTSFKKSGLYENIAIEIIKAAEQSGALDEMFGYVANYYKQKYDLVIDNLSAYLEPILLVIISAVVLLLGLGIFMPLWELSSGAILD
ncbi:MULTISPECIES: type II secretion system F family protein [Campylobacter]|uniref:type II secretion system F family protein n=1 Tax=Campylobacter TaxID=194 RepID=UPI000A34C884|nr:MULTISPECIES: type II secretion system F family protein [unclassified Campylobacter]MBE6430203.1 type II secretion system F family protein [Campylobacter sp.]